MNFSSNISAVHLIGIGGIGMSALARFFNQNGNTVSGYDRTSSAITDSLKKEGINIHFEDDVNLIPEEITKGGTEGKLIIYTPAVSADHGQLTYLQNNGFEVLKRSAVLGLITKEYRTVAVAGTHGKTTTSSILSHILKSSALDCTAFLGGISTNYNSNFLSSASSQLMVVEADEYDRSFLTLSPEMAIVTSMDADHLDIYGDANELSKTFIEFTQRLPENGTLIYREGLPLSNVPQKKFTYSIDSKADYYATDMSIENGQFTFDLTGPFGKMSAVKFGMPGLHNMENAVAAVAASHQLGVSENEIRAALGTYIGVKRRFEMILDQDGITFIDDYAHHPAELDACIGSVRTMYPNRRVTGIFQPHLFTRTRDHLNEFATSLSKLDKLYLLDIYPARELPIEGITSQVLLEKIDLKEKLLVGKEELLNIIPTDKIEVLLTLGAGDIDRLIKPIAAKIQTNNA